MSERGPKPQQRKEVGLVGALVIVFRETIEAGIIVGIVLAASRGAPGSRMFAALGVLAGLIGASIVAAFAGFISDAFEGVGQELLNATILLVAVAMLAWHNAWMASHGRELAAEAKALGAAVREGATSLTTLAIVIGVAVVREGSEVVLFLYGLVAAGGTSAGDLMLGGLLGLVAGAALSALTYFGLAAIPPRQLFAVTTALITFLAAGLAAQAVAFLQQAGVVTALDGTAWNTSAFLSDTSVLGRVLRTLIGYSDQPSWGQVAVYVATLAIIFALSATISRRSVPAASAAR